MYPILKIIKILPRVELWSAQSFAQNYPYFMCESTDISDKTQGFRLAGIYVY